MSEAKYTALYGWCMSLALMHPTLRMTASADVPKLLAELEPLVPTPTSDTNNATSGR